MLTGSSVCVGGSVDCSDWLRADCAVDFSAGEVRIGYIRPRLWTDSLIDAAPVTGSFINPALSDCLIVLCTAGFSSTWTFCSTDFVLLSRFVLSVRRVNDFRNMAADGAELAEVRAGITFGVKLYGPWDAPEAVVDVSSESVMPLRNIPDAIGLVVSFHSGVIGSQSTMAPAVLSHMGWRQQELGALLISQTKNNSINQEPIYMV